MTTKRDTPTCPACKKAWVSADSKWHVCQDCPYRIAEPMDRGEPISLTVTFTLDPSRLDEVSAVVRDIQDGESHATIDLAVLIEKFAELSERARNAARKEAEVVFGE